MDKTKKRSHPLAEKAPIVILLFGGLVMFVLISILGTIISAILKQFISFRDYESIDLLCTVFAALLVLAFHKFWYRPDYKGAFRNWVSVSTMLKLSAVGFVYIVIIFILSVIDNHGVYFRPTFRMMCMALSAGVVEETAMRVIPVSIGMRYLKSNNRIMLACVISSVIFGLMHAANLAAGATVPMTVIQVIATGFTGLYLCALYQRTGSILPAMLWHTVNDFVNFACIPSIADGVMNGAVTWSLFVDLGCTVLMGLFGLWVIRRENREKILTIWAKIWSRDLSGKDIEGSVKDNG